jgi:predicted metalloprotease with PDZ domain
MSEHLWMYEGVTEYFAIFSNQSGLILKKNSIWPKRLKMQTLNDTMPFTTMKCIDRTV